ncbi:hypothetical protein [Pararhizobium arenae]|uniref:hypothetical protein n=1 Tax=Pararhizobium arenae TaxID=1856850 RepID=UPI000A70F74B|nr:hypothetical protein [Pararhizobium arenae]
MDDDRTPTGLAPSADTKEEKKQKVVMGRGTVAFIGGVAIVAFLLYAFVALYAIFTAE